MKTLNELAIYGFEKGADNFGEKVTGVSDELTYNKMIKGYSKTVFLEQAEDQHPCTSGIGFYLVGDNMLNVYSSKEVTRVEITPEIQAELDKATIVEF